MDDWTYRYPYVDVPDMQPTLLNQEWLVMEARRVRARLRRAHDRLRPHRI